VGSGSIPHSRLDLFAGSWPFWLQLPDDTHGDELAARDRERIAWKRISPGMARVS
jgi:hypothetical protein